MLNYGKKGAVLTLVLFALTQPFVYTQAQHKIDSLTRVLQNAKTDTARISVQNKLVKEYMLQSDSASAVNFAYHSLALAKNTSSSYHKAYADQILGYVHTVLMHTDSSIFYNSRVISRLGNQTSNESIQLVVYATNNMAAVYGNSGRLTKTAAMFISNLPRLEKIGDTRAYEMTMQNIAACFNNLGEYYKAYPYMVKSITLVDIPNNPPDAKLGPYLTGALLMFRMDSLVRMKEYLTKTKENLDKIGHSTPASGRYYAYEAWYNARMNNLEEADRMLAQAIKELKVFGSRANHYDVATAKKEVARARKNYGGARDAALQTYQMGVEDGDNASLRQGALEAAIFSDQLGDYKTAYQYLQKYSNNMDSTKYEQMVFEVHDLETKYQTSEKEKQIAVLQGEKKQAVLINKNQLLLNWLLGISAGVLLLAILLLIYFYRNSKKQAMQQLSAIEQQQELRLAQALLEGEDRERTRVARDLHDGLGGTLSGIKLKLSGRKADTAVVDEAVLQLEDSIGELRRIARNMMPESLVKSGLETALRNLCASLSGESRAIEFQANGISKVLPLPTQVNIYRIIQELLANAIRHSAATNIIVQCIQENTQFLITVEDNGRGFNTTTAKTAKGIGLDNIYNRVNYAKGKLDIRSEPGEGTSINIELYV